MLGALPVVHFLDVGIGDALPELVGDADCRLELASREAMVFAGRRRCRNPKHVESLLSLL